MMSKFEKKVASYIKNDIMTMFNEFENFVESQHNLSNDEINYLETMVFTVFKKHLRVH